LRYVDVYIFHMSPVISDIDDPVLIIKLRVFIIYLLSNFITTAFDQPALHHFTYDLSHTVIKFFLAGIY